MKKDWLMIVGIAIVVVIASLISAYKAPESLGAGGNFSNPTYFFTTSVTPYRNNLTATTTQTNLTYIGSASTTEEFSTEGIDQVNFNLLGLTATSTSLSNFTWNGAVVSSSDTKLNLIYCYQYSDDQVTYFAPTSNCGTVITESLAATSTPNIAVTNVNSKYMRIQLSAPAATSTRFGLWGNAALKKGF